MIIDINKDKVLEMDIEDGIVCIGTGGDLKDWVDGVNEILFEEGVVDTPEYFTEVYSFITAGELHNLLFPFPEIMDGFDIGRMAIVRMKYIDWMKWLSDYKVNFNHLLQEDE